MTKADSIEAHYAALDVEVNELQHPEWAKARPVRITRYWSGAQAPVSRHAETRILYTKESLVVRFVGQQTGPPIVSPNPQLNKKTIGLWDRDVCEIFIAPDLNRPNHYFEFEAAPTGEWIDLAIHVTPSKRETDWDFNSGMTAAGHIAEHNVTIAMRIPWDDWIHQPQRGEKWRVNLFRCIGVGNDRYLAWQPTFTREPNFHVPERFGWLTFS
jgi:hypothetical protein